VKYFDWDEEKNQWLIDNRGISFEFIKECIENDCVIGNIPNHSLCEHQKVLLILIEDYIYEIPYVEDDKKIFLKTAYPSHKETERFRKLDNSDNS